MQKSITAIQLYPSLCADDVIDAWLDRRLVELIVSES